MPSPCPADPHRITVRLAPGTTAVHVRGASDLHRHDDLDPLPVAWAVGQTLAARDFYLELELDTVRERAARRPPPDALRPHERFPVLRALRATADEDLSDEAIAALEARVAADLADEGDAADLAADLAARRLEAAIAADWAALKASFADYVTARRLEAQP